MKPCLSDIMSQLFQLIKLVKCVLTISWNKIGISDLVIVRKTEMSRLLSSVQVVHNWKAGDFMLLIAPERL